MSALAWIRRDGTVFELVAREILQGAAETPRAAAVRTLLRIPEGVWSRTMLEPLARSMVKTLSETPPDRRTDPASEEAVQLGEKLAALLPEDSRRAVRRDLRALTVQIVRITTIPEQLSFDLKWFVVEAGKPVQVVLFNPDAMPHNLVISKPGSLQEVATAGGAMPPTSDPGAKAFVPDLPLVLFATRLLQAGETERLGFTAPKEPGEYVYACTFPGHWVRMYGIMLVVEKRETWEASPVIPTDPMTKKPFASERH